MALKGWMVVCTALLLLGAGCGSGGGREIEIVAEDAACGPTTLRATAGEKLTFKVTNNAKGDRELEGIEGTRFEEILVPAGRVRKANYSVPKQEGVQKLKCYIPGGPSTIIELQVSPS